MNTDKQHKKKKQDKRKQKKEEKKDSRVLSYSSTYNLTKQYITNCPELRRLQFSETNIFNVFLISYAIIFSNTRLQFDRFGSNLHKKF